MNNGFVLLGDQPHVAVRDPLGFEEIVKGLAELILGSRGATPFTLGIEGTWGTGKSTLIGALRKRLDGNPEVATVQFNAWTAQESEVLEAFVKTVLSAVKPHYLRRAIYRQKAFGALRAGLSGAAAVVGQSATVDKVWDQVATDPRARNELRDLVQVTIDSWRKKTTGRGTRLLCVFVDDLDRCSPRVVLEMLEAMKLYLDVPGMVFVLGYDDDIVSDVVLRDKGYGDKTRARDYLEKFIQISYRIPRSAESQSETLIETLLRSSGTSELLGGNERQLVVEGSRSNPRRIKRFINSFVLIYGLDARWREFHPQSLVRVLLLRMYFPEFARLLEDASERDPVEEFLEYEAAWAALRKEAPQEGQAVDTALRSHGLPAAQDAHKEPKELLAMLNENVPVEFPMLAARSEFVGLVRSLFQDADWEGLRGAMSGGALSQIAPSEVDDDWDPHLFTGLRILWVDDEVEANNDLIDAFAKGGARVAVATGSEETMALLASEPFDVLISDIARGEDHEAGLDLLEMMRSSHPSYVPPAVIFFTSRMTPSRVERVKALGAEITTNPGDLLDFVFDLPRGKS